MTENSDNKKIARARIDRGLCIGAATCMAVMPESFELDGEDKAVLIRKDGSKSSDVTMVADLQDDNQEMLLMAAQSCPTQAIFLEDDDGEQVYP